MHRVFAVALQACEIICAKTSLGHKTFRLVETVAYKGFGWCGHQPIKKKEENASSASGIFRYHLDVWKRICNL